MTKMRLLTAGAVLALVGGAGRVQAAPFFQVAGPGGVGGVNNFPAGEAPTNVRDAMPGTKYLNFGEDNTGIIESFPTAVTATGIIFATANDGPERDPLTFSLYGSNTRVITGTEAAGTNIDLGTEFTLIAADQPITGFTTDPGRLTAVPNQPVTNATAYRTYAIVFPTVRNAAAANSLQIGDIIFTNGGTALAGQATNPVIGGESVVPEPASLGLLGLGSLGLLARRRGRRA